MTVSPGNGTGGSSSTCNCADAERPRYAVSSAQNVPKLASRSAAFFPHSGNPCDSTAATCPLPYGIATASGNSPACNSTVVPGFRDSTAF